MFGCTGVCDCGVCVVGVGMCCCSYCGIRDIGYVAVVVVLYYCW